ncbi:uncharacterized protein SPPG_06952 [Spizellomyces punctatus DAOM BR117]|uniref:Uncharacterized protein n=1 Tax=Spizellomyces punctatus (strain DAOM BR117) TaxID=645134 RepID=A0A0L0HAP0_SPIPD|nr:uncharacterized protein SPPG_06952 [Spizellomyces punctatus DAOM BR117]KNC97964.1 hypothetical protein SPPG_06952 [Spizellomyces punctatus DAOM BR117]|eukprot:XP_016606004.1 hypothetical protein SPPG_06952 [Spizellomyces punctatus DAOM BR117]
MSETDITEDKLQNDDPTSFEAATTDPPPEHPNEEPLSSETLADTTLLPSDPPPQDDSPTDPAIAEPEVSPTSRKSSAAPRPSSAESTRSDANPQRPGTQGEARKMSASGMRVTTPGRRGSGAGSAGSRKDVPVTGRASDIGSASRKRQGSVGLFTDVITESVDEDEIVPQEVQVTSVAVGETDKLMDVYEEVEELADSGWETDLDVSDVLNRKNQQDLYTAACIALGIVPVSFIIDRLKGEEIVMPHHGLGPKGAHALAQVLEGNTTLKRIDLTNNWIESGGAYLGRSLQINRALVYLNLTGNRLGYEGSHEIAEMLQFNASLKTLILKDNKLGDREAQLFSEGLRQNSCLQVLDLSYNEIGDIGAIALGVGLVGNDALKELNLGWNQIRHRGIAGLLNGLKDNLILTHLNLESNGLGENGAAVASFLLKNNAIQVLNLRRTRCGDGAIGTIGKAIEQNYSLKEFDCSDNLWTDQGAQLLFKGLMNSSSMRKLYMQNIKLTKDIRVKIDELKAEKPELAIIEMSEADMLIAAKEARIRKEDRDRT